MEESISEQTPISVSIPQNSPHVHPSTQTSHSFSSAGLGVNEDIVDENNNELIEVLVENMVHQIYKHGRSI
uniref:Uncharacterized protein n=1 Tax=Tanacetum cinerariifolium TaxID=118510 RepID=A0A699VUX1_TANCI|nr:hypothetical protein [Tanacetum cinerariifolium]